MIETSQRPKVFAIVLNYNGKDCLLQCLDSIYSCDYPSLEVVVVDNDSSDGSLELAMKKFQRFHFIKNSQNIGFAAGNNVAIRFALEKMADYIFLLNNDATIEKNAISNLVREGESHKKRGILSPVIMDDNNKSIWFSGGKIHWKKMKTAHEHSVFQDTPYLTEYGCGCALLIKKEVFKEIGLFDEIFFLYYEDADFSWRARISGFEITVVPDAIVWHKEKSRHENTHKLYWLVLSGLIFFKKNSKGLKSIWIFMYILARKTKLFFRRFSDKNSSETDQIYRAFSDFKKTAL